MSHNNVNCYQTDPHYKTKADLYTHVFRVPDVMSSVTSTMHLRPLEGDSHES